MTTMVAFTFDGLAKLARDLTWRASKDASVPEKLFWDTYHISQDHDFVELVPQYEVVGPNYRYRFDFAYPRLKVAVEIDGLAYHSGQTAIMRDHRRQRQLERDDWRFIRFAAKEVLVDPERCVREVALSIRHLT
jgi:very-short-patch-repair endonuclease